MIVRGRALPWRGLRRGVWVVVCLAGVAASARGAPGDPTVQGELPALVTVTILGDPTETSRIDESVREVARRLGLTVAPAGGAPLLARLTIDLRGAEVSVLVADADGHTIVSRSIPRSVSPEVLREEVALIVADALDAARALEATRAKAKPPPATASAAPPTLAPIELPPERDRTEPTGVRTELLAFLAGRDRDPSAHVALGAGLGARVSARGSGLRPMGALSGEVGFPWDAAARDTELRVSPYAVRVSPGITGRLSTEFELDATAGLGLDALHVAPRSAASGVAANDATTKVSPVLAPAAAARLRLGSARLTLAFGLDVDLVRRRYVVATPGGNVEALSAWPVRPVLTLGLSLPITGADDGE